jgi:nickel-dependent lactate racemase
MRFMENFAEGSATADLAPRRIEALLEDLVRSLGRPGRVLIVPPDFTRFGSGAGEITASLYDRLSRTAKVTILPALGTHLPMSRAEIAKMFPGVPARVFGRHDWRGPLAHLGDVPESLVEKLSEGRLRFPISWEVHPALLETRWDRIISVGQVLPHEVSGFSNHSKNLLVGLGGAEAIHKTHFFAAVYGRERILGRLASPLRTIFDRMACEHLGGLPITYVMTVRGPGADGRPVTRGLFAGEGLDSFREAARLCRRVNITLLQGPLRKVVVYLPPQEYKSAWLGNKSIYRTCMALAEGAELLVLAPGVAAFGEDPALDALIRAHGYRGKKAVLEALEKSPALRADLGAAAALINGSSEGRFSITYATSGLGGGRGLTRKEVESVGYRFAPLAEALERYGPGTLRDGFNTLGDGERVFFISNPGQGLWALLSQIEE